jgi:hypothetical protein
MLYPWRKSLDAVSLRRPSRPNVDAGEGMKQPENIQQPQDNRNDHDAIQNGLDRSLHGDEAIYQPQEDTHHDENFQQLN